jgi:hypothetical protein
VTPSDRSISVDHCVGLDCTSWVSRFELKAIIGRSRKRRRRKHKQQQGRGSATFRICLLVDVSTHEVCSAYIGIARNRSIEEKSKM